MHGCESVDRLAIFDDRARGLDADSGDRAHLCFTRGVQVDQWRVCRDLVASVLAVRGSYVRGVSFDGRGGAEKQSGYE